jgi:hypothetical protein
MVCLPDLHSTFSNVFYLYFDKMPGPIAPKNIKTRLADTRAKLVEVIAKWELSGNDFGQRTLLEDGTHKQGFGHLAEEHFQAGVNRSSLLLEDCGECILCMWGIFDNADMLDTMISVLSKEVAFELETDDLTTAACSGNESTRKKRCLVKQNNEEMREFRSRFSAALSCMSHSSLVENLCATESTVIKCTFKAMSPCIGAAAEKALDNCIATQKGIVSELKDKLASIVPSPALKVNVTLSIALLKVRVKSKENLMF